MRIFIVDRDLDEVKGIEWYLKTYLAHTLTIAHATNCQQLEMQLAQFQAQLLLIETELITPAVERTIVAANVPVIAVTAEPTFQQAMRAIAVKATHFFIKPLPLEKLKSILLTLPVKAQVPTNAVTHASNAELYLQLFLDSKKHYSEPFFVMEPAQFAQNFALYEWLTNSPIFEEMTVLPLQNRIFGLLAKSATTKTLRLVMQEWQKFSGEQVNIALYDGEMTTLQEMYKSCKQALSQRFYKGYGHIFMSTQSLTITRFDPLLTPSEQQQWITNLENGDLKAIKETLYELTQTPPYYHYDDMRIHLTSILAQIRRFMLKYKLQQHLKLEEQYRALFHHILEHPILYAIVQEFILFTQQLIHVKNANTHAAIADYDERAIEYIEAHYKNSALSLADVAQQLHINANYLSTVFSKKRGIPFKKYLQQYRVQQAATLLLETDFPVAVIAEAVGFGDANYFIKVFKDFYKTTPSRYRAEKNKRA